MNEVIDLAAVRESRAAYLLEQEQRRLAEYLQWAAPEDVPSFFAWIVSGLTSRDRLLPGRTEDAVRLVTNRLFEACIERYAKCDGAA